MRGFISRVLAKKVMGILLIITIVTGLRVPFVSVPFFNVDEALMALMADTILEGGVIYRDAWEHQAPLSYFIYALVFTLFGKNNMTAIHLFAMGWIALTALMIFKLADYLYGYRRKVGLLAGSFYAIFSTSYESWWVLAANTEVFMVLPITAGIFYLLKAEGETRSRYFILSGIMCGLGTMTKQTGGVVLPVMLSYPLLTVLLQRKAIEWKKIIQNWVLILLGFSLILGIGVGYFWLNNALKDFFYLTVEHPYQYSQVMNLKNFIYRFKVRTASIVIPNFLLWGMAFITMGSILLRSIRNYWKKDWKEIEVRELLLVLWLFASLVALSLGGRFFGHYYLQAFPVLSLLAAAGILFLPEWLLKKNSLLPFSKVVIWIIVFVGILLPVVKYQKQNYDRFIIQRDNPQLSYDKYEASFKPVANYIGEHTTPADYIFVWGFCPQIYILANRKPSSRFIFCNFLTGRMSESPDHFDPQADTSDRITLGSWEKLLKDLKKREPKFIIDASPSDYLKYAKYPIRKYVLLQDFLDSNYLWETEISKMPIYRLKNRSK